MHLPNEERILPDGGLHYPALVLNADFRPLSYFPLSVWSWQDFDQGGVPGPGQRALRI